MRKRNNKIELYLSDEEYKHLVRIVKRSGLNKSSYLRQLISGVTPKDAPPLDYYHMMRELNYIGNNLNQIAHMANAIGLINEDEYEKNVNLLKEAILTITKAVLLPEK